MVHSIFQPLHLPSKHGLKDFDPTNPDCRECQYDGLYKEDVEDTEKVGDVITSLHDYSVRFDSNDPTTVKFLEKIKWSSEQIASGSIPYDNTALVELANFESFYDQYLSPNEASLGLRMIRGNKNLTALFDPNKCPGKSPPMARIIFGNHLGLANQKLFGAVAVEDKCPYDAAYTPSELTGIHYSNAMMTRLAILLAGKSVVLVFSGEGLEKERGSAVVLSSNGDVITARHVLYDKMGRFRRDAYILVNGERHPMQEGDVVIDNRSLDIATLRVSSLQAKVRGIPTAPDVPKQGDELWVIGFPKQGLGEKDMSSPEKTYTIGRLNNKSAQLFGQRYTISAQTAPGDSGGAVVNKRGELVGILNSALVNGTILENVLDSRANMLHKQLLDCQLNRHQPHATAK